MPEKTYLQESVKYRTLEVIIEIKVTTLTENTANNNFLAEWGLSMLVEVNGLRILVDTGQSFSTTYNAHRLGIDLATVDHVVISHGHTDHTGGLREVLKRSGEKQIIGHPDIWASKYARYGEEKERYIGIPHSREELESRGARFQLVREPVHIAEQVMTSGEIPMTSGYEEIENHLLVKIGSKFQPDPLADDLILIIDTDFGLVVITGCAHRGIVNALRHAQNLTGKELIYAAIGGTHLFRASEERIDRTIADLREMGIQKLGVSHCTGFRASWRLAQEFGDIFFLNNAGTQFTLP